MLTRKRKAKKNLRAAVPETRADMGKKQQLSSRAAVRTARYRTERAVMEETEECAVNAAGAVLENKTNMHVSDSPAIKMILDEIRSRAMTDPCIWLGLGICYLVKFDRTCGGSSYVSYSVPSAAVRIVGPARACHKGRIRARSPWVGPKKRPTIEKSLRTDGEGGGKRGGKRKHANESYDPGRALVHTLYGERF